MIDKALLEVIGDAAMRYGISRFKCSEFEISFEGQPRLVVSGENQTRGIGEEHGMPTEDELLFASSIPLTSDEIRAMAP